MAKRSRNSVGEGALIGPGDYPPDWRKISGRVRFSRARGRCERCGKKHGETVWCGPEGSWAGDDNRWHDDRGNEIPCPPPWPGKQWYRNLWLYAEPPRLRRVRVVLHTAHLNHNPADCHEANLMALCQSCHVRYDMRVHRWIRRTNTDLKRGQRLLFA